MQNTLWNDDGDYYKVRRNEKFMKIYTTLGYIFMSRCFTKRLQSRPLNWKIYVKLITFRSTWVDILLLVKETLKKFAGLVFDDDTFASNQGVEGTVPSTKFEHFNFLNVHPLYNVTLYNT